MRQTDHLPVTSRQTVGLPRRPSRLRRPEPSRPRRAAFSPRIGPAWYERRLWHRAAPAQRRSRHLAARRPSVVTTAPRPTLTWILRVAKVLVVVGALLGAVSARVVIAGEREIALSTAALRAGDPHEAALHARRAAGFYAPGAPHVRVAYDRLIALATKAEQLGDTATALFAWQSVRSAAIETRWIVTPHEPDLVRANAAIARLQAAQERPLGTRVEPAAVIEREALEALQRDEAPHVPWVIALVIGFFSWVIGAIFVVRRGVTTTGTVLWDRVRFPVVLTIAGIALWLIAIWRA